MSALDEGTEKTGIQAQNSRSSETETVEESSPRKNGLISNVADTGKSIARGASEYALQTWRVTRATKPILSLLANEEDVSAPQLHEAVDALFKHLYRHPLVGQSTQLTGFLRKQRLIPNEQSTEDLIRFLVDQIVQRSPVTVPEPLINEFWTFFDELFSSPELRGLGELSIDMVRLVVQTYEPMLVEIINLLKAGRRFNQWQLKELTRRAGIVRSDLRILQRQIKALRYIRPFFMADPKDFHAQARIVSDMVREFGPFFIKMAQVAAANADFLPEEVAKELAVFHEDVPPMSASEVVAAFMECHGRPPQELYMDFDPAKPLKSGSIGSVYLARKPMVVDGQDVLIPVVVKVGRHNIDREFVIGKLVIGLAIMSTHYWAPHSKLAPFLRAMQEQVDEFVLGFERELDFHTEAKNQLRFYKRAQQSRRWRVPAVYGVERRILEMEYIADAKTLVSALESGPPARRRRLQRRITRNLIYAITYHVAAWQELHGDLHPGNLMVKEDGALYLIDWGNCVTMDGKWAAVWNYLVGALVADTEMLTDALIAISTDPVGNLGRRDEIRAALDDTMRKKGIEPLTARTLFNDVRKRDFDAWHRRLQTAMHLMSNTQSLGLVVIGDYLHLSRSLFAAIGSFGSIYAEASRLQLFQDVAIGVGSLPLTLVQDRVETALDRFRGRVRERFPVLESPTMRELTHARLQALTVDPA